MRVYDVMVVIKYMIYGNMIICKREYYVEMYWIEDSQRKYSNSSDIGITDENIRWWEANEVSMT